MYKYYSMITVANVVFFSDTTTVVLFLVKYIRKKTIYL